MAGVNTLESTETAANLQQRLRTQKTASDQERIQLLYLLQSGQAPPIQTAATLLGRHRVTVQKWLRLYRRGGLETLLAHTSRTGRRQSLAPWAQAALNKQLHESEGFNSYGKICQWLERQLGISAPYQTVHQLVHYRLKAAPKVARPLSAAHIDDRVEAAKKTR